MGSLSSSVPLNRGVKPRLGASDVADLFPDRGTVRHREKRNTHRSQIEMISGYAYVSIDRVI